MSRRSSRPDTVLPMRIGLVSNAIGTGSLEDGTEGELEFLDDIPLNEFEWEQELRDADRRAEAYQEAFEKYRDHPERE